MESSFYADEKNLLKFILKKNLFNEKNCANNFTTLSFEEVEALKAQISDPRRLFVDYVAGIDLIVRPECNQKCKYCYITQHGDELYPKEQRVKNNIILQNLRSLLDYIYKKNGLYIACFDLFAGDMFFDGLYFDLLDIFYEYLLDEHRKYTKLYSEASQYPMLIEAPVNMSFIMNDDILNKFDKYFNKFNKIGVKLYFSASVDGAYCTATREGKEMPNEYFDKIFQFCKKYGFFFHPMIGADNIENWIENYDWWKIKLKEYDFEETLGPGHYLPMMLEVRNNDWEPEKINAYIKFINHMLEDRLAMNGYDVKKLTQHLFVGDGEFGSIPNLTGYDPLKLIIEKDCEGFQCDLQTMIHIRLNDLTIVPCHRTSYKQFEAGQFITNGPNHRIIDLEPNNPLLYITIMGFRRETLPKCARCAVQPFCIAGCLGSQYETNGELFFPCNTVCDLFICKFVFLIYKYEKLGIFEEANKLGYLNPEMKKAINTIKALDVYERLSRYYGEY